MRVAHGAAGLLPTEALSPCRLGMWERKPQGSDCLPLGLPPSSTTETQQMNREVGRVYPPACSH